MSKFQLSSFLSCLLIQFALATLVVAEPEAPAKNLLERVEEAGLSRTAYSCRFTVEDEIKGTKSTATGDMLWAAPCRIRMRSRIEIPRHAQTLLAFDGRDAWYTLQSPEMKFPKVVRESVPAEAEPGRRERIWERMLGGNEALPPHAALEYYSTIYQLAQVEEEAELDGQRMHIFTGGVRKGGLKTMMLKRGGTLEKGTRLTGVHFDPDLVEAGFGTIKLWIGQDDLMLHRAEQTIAPAPSSPPETKPDKSIRTYTDFDLNPKFSSGDFLYAPPEGSLIREK